MEKERWREEVGGVVGNTENWVNKWINITEQQEYFENWHTKVGYESSKQLLKISLQKLHETLKKK